ncbi:MAG: hypothetical protein ABSC48_06485 [Terracidiphilus sp.]
MLDVETERWSQKSCEQLVAELREVLNYEVVVDAKRYQVEVGIIENKQDYIHVALGVDDGSFPWSILPVARTFIRQKGGSG